jgi:hypothetical protein
VEMPLGRRRASGTRPALFWLSIFFPVFPIIYRTYSGTLLALFITTPFLIFGCQEEDDCS